MTTQTEALKLALHVMRNQGDIGVDEWIAAEKTILEALEKEALHKLAAESLNEGLRLDDWPKIGCVNHDCDQCKAQQEPVAITEQMAFAFHNAITDGALGTDDMMDIMRGLEAAFSHITTPQPQPAREWVGLTKEDKAEIVAATDRDDRGYVMALVEAKLMEKNT